MSDRKATHFIVPAVVALVLLGLHVGAYYATVDVKVDTAWRRYGVVTVEEATGTSPTYSVWHPWTRPFFAPVHWLDRRIRPQFWEP